MLPRRAPSRGPSLWGERFFAGEHGVEISGKLFHAFHSFRTVKDISGSDPFNHGASTLRRCICYRKGPRSDAGTQDDHQWLRPALSLHCGNVLVGMGYAVGSSSHSVVRSAPTAGARRKRRCKTTSSAGYPTARGTNTAVASGEVPQRARETLLCERCWEKWPGSSPA